MIRLITGGPGSGKTLRLLWAVMELQRTAKLEATAVHDQLEPQVPLKRRVFYRGIAGLSPELEWTEVSDSQVNSWHEWMKPGDVLVIDEAQQVWGGRMVTDWRKDNKTSMGALPDWITKLETHRHMGVDFFLVSQRPSYLHKHVLGLVGKHEHLIRHHGMKRADVFSYDEALDVSKETFRIRALKHVWTHPEEIYRLYKSAEVHTHKRKLPPQALWGVGAGVLLVVCLGALWYMKGRVVASEASPKAEISPEAESAKGLSFQAPTVAGPPDKKTLTAEEYVAALQPRIPGFPQTAPRYDDLNKPVTMPKPAACLYTKERDDCYCWSQQATRLPIPREQCLAFVSTGWFDDTVKRGFDGEAAARPATQERRAAEPLSSSVLVLGSAPGKDLSQRYSGAASPITEVEEAPDRVRRILANRKVADNVIGYPSEH